jgi:hypothetical protein
LPPSKSTSVRFSGDDATKREEHGGCFRFLEVLGIMTSTRAALVASTLVAFATYPSFAAGSQPRTEKQGHQVVAQVTCPLPAMPP